MKVTAEQEGGGSVADTTAFDRFYRSSYAEVVRLAHLLSGSRWFVLELPGVTPATADVQFPGAPESGDAEWMYTGPDTAHYDVFVHAGGESVYEDWLREHTAGGADALVRLTVDGREGVLVVPDEGDELVALWRPTDTAVVDFRTSGTLDDMVAALEALRPVDEAAWAAHLPPGIRPDGIG
jgi:hypothetical protein